VETTLDPSREATRTGVVVGMVAAFATAFLKRVGASSKHRVRCCRWGLQRRCWCLGVCPRGWQCRSEAKTKETWRPHRLRHWPSGRGRSLPNPGVRPARLTTAAASTTVAVIDEDAAVWTCAHQRPNHSRHHRCRRRRYTCSCRGCHCCCCCCCCCCWHQRWHQR